MSRVLVIPDIHLKPWIFDMADKISKDLYDDIVVLGDLVDDWGQKNNINLYKETLDRAIQFGIYHDRSLWCYGNHDVSYLWDTMESGYSLYARETVIEGITKLENVLEDRYQFIHKIDNVLFSHAGLTESFVTYNCGTDTKNIDDILSKINHMGEEELWKDNSPIWARPQMDPYRMYESQIFYQVVGHTPIRKPLNESGVLTLDLFSTRSDGSDYGNKKLYIIDTNTKEFKEAV